MIVFLFINQAILLLGRAGGLAGRQAGRQSSKQSIYQSVSQSRQSVSQSISHMWLQYTIVAPFLSEIVGPGAVVKAACLQSQRSWVVTPLLIQASRSKFYLLVKM